LRQAQEMTAFGANPATTPSTAARVPTRYTAETGVIFSTAAQAMI